MDDLDSKSKKSDPCKETEKNIIGINIISQLVSKVIDDPSQIYSGLKQIFFFWQLLPEEWKKRAYYIFEKLWNKGKVVISTHPDKPKQIYDVFFDDPQLSALFLSLPPVDQSILIQAKGMVDLIKKGLHNSSDEIKKGIEWKHGIRGLNIANMLTTKDIYYLIEELPEKPTKQDYEQKFNSWAAEYNSIALLISPFKIKNSVQGVEQDILEIAKLTPKKYILLNLSGGMEECMRLQQVVYTLKERKKLLINDIENDIFDSGFCKSIRMRVLLPE